MTYTHISHTVVRVMLVSCLEPKHAWYCLRHVELLVYQGLSNNKGVDDNSSFIQDVTNEIVDVLVEDFQLLLGYNVNRVPKHLQLPHKA